MEIITGTDKLVLIDVFDSKIVGCAGCDLELMQILANHQISYTFKATSANSISTAIWQKDCSKKLINELESTFQKITVDEVAMVCLLGSNMDRPGLLAKSAKVLALEGINIKCVSFAMRKVNIQFLIGREDYTKAVIALNSRMTKRKIARIRNFHDSAGLKAQCPF